MTQIENHLAHLQRFGIRPGLERVREILRSLGNPHDEYPIVLVGGTNGKGSTCEFLARRLATETKRVGLYTSPHLYRWNERVRVLDIAQKFDEAFAGSITDDKFDALFETMQPILDDIARDERFGQPTEFETLTALGLLHFAQQKIDIAVVEVGLGGKLDATNVTNPTVSVVTHVALDHCDRLGNTHVEIARDKVCIARPNCVLVTGETRDDVLEVFREHCDQIGAKLWSLRNIEYSNDRENLQSALGNPLLQNDSDAPDFQRLNAQTALLARVALAQNDANWPLPQTEISPTFASLPGRFQIVAEKPTTILDGANNPDGAQQLALQLKKLLNSRPESRLILVLGILQDKDFRAMIAHLAPLAHRVFATQSDSPRACPAQTVAKEASQFCPNVEVVVPINEAVRRARAFTPTSSTRSDLVCVTGSFYTIGEVALDFSPDQASIL